MEDTQLLDLKRTIIVQASTIGLDTSFYEELDFGDRREETRNIIEIMERCIAQEIDPWRVDVVNFVKIVRELTTADLMTIAEAGYIIYKSWGIVYVQASDLIDTFGKKENEFIQEQGDEDFIANDFNDMEEEKEFISLKMPVKHHETRKVMLVELIEVMRKTELSREKIVRVPHLEQILEVDEIYEVLNSGEPEKDMEAVLNRIRKISEDNFFMEDVWGTTREERIKFFVYSMFLRKNDYIGLTQEYSYDRIRIEKKF